MKTLLEIRDFVNWVFHYKTIKEEYETELKSSSLELIRLNKKIKEKDKIIEDREKAISLQIKAFDDETIKKNDIKKLLASVEKENSRLKAKIESMKLEKTAIGKEMKELTIELEETKDKLEETTNRLDYCKKHRRAPDMSQIVAYTYSQKEVLKRENERND